jgi:hypothetical protein
MRRVIFGGRDMPAETAVSVRCEDRLLTADG